MKNTRKMKSEPRNLLKSPVFVQVVARDDDQGANGQLSYVLSGGNDEGAFSLSASGQLSLTRTLDRESRSEYVLLISATDSGETAGRRHLGLFIGAFCRVIAVDPTWPPLRPGLKKTCFVIRKQTTSRCLLAWRTNPKLWASPDPFPQKPLQPPTPHPERHPPSVCKRRRGLLYLDKRSTCYCVEAT